MKTKEKKKAKPGRLKIRVVFTAGAVGLFGAACFASPVAESPCTDCGPVHGTSSGGSSNRGGGSSSGGSSNLDGGHDGGVDAGQDAGEDGGRDGGDGG